MVGEVRRRMIGSAALLLARRGLQGTSFSEVLEASGAPHGAIYHHFPGGKQELVLASMDAARDRAMAALDAMEGQPAGEIAEAFLGIWRSVLTASGLGAGCAIAAVTVAADSPALLDRAGEAFHAWRVRLAGLLAAGGSPVGRSAGLAAGLIAASEGAVIMARAERCLEPFDLVAAEQVAAIRAASEPIA